MNLAQRKLEVIKIRISNPQVYTFWAEPFEEMEVAFNLATKANIGLFVLNDGSPLIELSPDLPVCLIPAAYPDRNTESMALTEVTANAIAALEIGSFFNIRIGRQDWTMKVAAREEHKHAVEWRRVLIPTASSTLRPTFDE